MCDDIRRWQKRAVQAEAEREQLRAAAEDEQKARKIAGGAADRFRDVVCEVLGYGAENPGDDVLITELRALHGKSGPEPTRWRDFLTGSIAHLEANGYRWRADAVAGDGELDDPPGFPRPLPIHRTEAGYPNCPTCDGGGCLDCTDPA